MEEKKQKKKKQTRCKSRSYRLFLDKEVIILLHNGEIVKGELHMVTSENIILKNCVIKGTKHICITPLMLIPKKRIIHLHLLEETQLIKIEELKEEQIYKLIGTKIIKKQEKQK